MSVKGDRGTGGDQIDDSWWASIVGRILHPMEVEIIEAMRLIDLPLSGGELCEVLDKQPHRIRFDHHLRRLSKLGAIEVVERPSRNRMDTRYRLMVPLRSEDI